MPDNQTEKTNTQTTTEFTSTSTNEDPVTWQKFLSGIGNFKNFTKIASYGINVLLIVLVIAGGMFIWGKFFPKKTTPTSTQTSTVTISPGASVEHLDFTTKTEIKEGPKKVGLEAMASSEDVSLSLVAYLSDHTAIAVGPRWKYRKVEGEAQVLPTIQLHYTF